MLIPPKVFDNIRKFGSGFNHTIYDDAECQVFLETYFSASVVTAFLDLQGAHRADLFRYAILYVHGGIYMDVKTELLAPLAYVFPSSVPNFIYSAISSVDYNTVYNGLLGSPPHNPLFLRLIHHMVHTPRPITHYAVFVKHLSQVILSQTFQRSLYEGENRSPGPVSFFLFTERNRPKVECYDGLDRRGGCFFITLNNEKLFKSRYSDFPW